MRAHRRTTAAVALALTPLLTSCGGQEPAGEYAAETERQLTADAADVREAAEARRVAETRRALERLTRHVADAQAAGRLPPERARAILAATDALAEDLAALPTPTPTPTRDTRSPAPEKQGREPEPAAPQPEKGRGDDAGPPDEWPGEGEKPEGWEAHKGEGEESGEHGD
jgi:hypothetical protein